MTNIEAYAIVLTIITLSLWRSNPEHGKGEV